MLAEVTSCSSASSLAQPSPRSAFKSIFIKPPYHLIHCALLMLARQHRLRQGAVNKVNRFTQTDLRQVIEVGFDNRGDAWIATGGLGIRHQHDGLSAGWHLNHARHDAV